MCAEPKPGALRRAAVEDGGATAVEFALISPLLMLLVVATLQLGWILHSAASVRWALEATARSVMLQPTLSGDEVKAAMRARLSGLADARDLNVTVTRQSASATLVLESRYAAPLALPFIPRELLVFESRVTIPERAPLNPSGAN